MLISQEKKKIRKSMTLDRKKKSLLYLDSAYIATKRVLENFNFYDEKIFGVYWPMEFEIDTRPLIKFLLIKKKKIALPVIEKKHMFFKTWKPYEPLIYTKYKFYSPKKNSNFIIPDVVIVPCLAIDNKGHRLGYGGGYYDRFYKKNSKIKYIGLSYSFQHFKSLPYEKHDLKLNFILTENVFRQVND